MIEELARVVGTEGEFAWVEAQAANGCHACAGTKACGSAALAGWFARRPPRFKVTNRVGARPGDDVVIGIEESALLAGSLLLYLAPLLFLLGFAFFGEVMGRQLALGRPEAVAIAGAAAGMALGLAWARRLSVRFAGEGRFQPVILRLTHAVLPFREERL